MTLHSSHSGITGIDASTDVTKNAAGGNAALRLSPGGTSLFQPTRAVGFSFPAPDFVRCAATFESVMEGMNLCHWICTAPFPIVVASATGHAGQVRHHHKEEDS